MGFSLWDDFDEFDAYDNVLTAPILLFQDREWVDGQGRLHIISRMEPDHASNVVGWLRRRSNKLLSRYMAAKMEDLWMVGYDDAVYAVEQKWGGRHFQWDAMPHFGDPSWLDHTPLVKALRARASDAWPVEELLEEAPVRCPHCVVGSST